MTILDVQTRSFPEALCQVVRASVGSAFSEGKERPSVSLSVAVCLRAHHGPTPAGNPELRDILCSNHHPLVTSLPHARITAPIICGTH